jgi:hypothetical protein
VPATNLARSPGVLRYSASDAALVAMSGVYAALLLSVPSIPLIAIGLWWTANTVAHNFIHTPFFRSRSLNRAFSFYLSALMGIPQELWRDRHLRHHRGDDRPLRWTRNAILESGLVLGLWLVAAVMAPWFFAAVYLPGYAAGMTLCWLQGHFEHVHGTTTSHYGRLYNLLFFNDGYHVEHHTRPGEHWTRLPLRAAGGAQASRWPPVLRWLDLFTLEALERIVLRSQWLQRRVLASHQRAFRILLADRPARRITIVGGGLFPRTALILRRLRPDAALTIIDANRDHLDVARRFLDGSIELRHEFYDPRVADEGELVVIPLSFIGDRERVYEHPPAAAVLVHDWMWKTRGGGVRVSWLLLKRLNLVTR